MLTSDILTIEVQEVDSRMAIWSAARPMLVLLAVAALVPAVATLSCQSGPSPELEALSNLADMKTVTDLPAVGGRPGGSDYIGGPDAPNYIEPMLRARIAEYVEALTEAAERGVPSTVPNTVPVVITATALDGDWGSGREAMRDFLFRSGATRFAQGRNPDAIHVPVTLFPRIIEHPQFSTAELALGEDEEYPYPVLDRQLNNVVAALTGGASPQQAASHALYRHENKVLVFARTEYSEAAVDALDRFFVDNDVYTVRHLAHDFTAQVPFVALVPASLIVSLSQHPEVNELGTIDDWSQVVRDLLIWHHLPPDQRSPIEPPTPDIGY